MINMTTKEFKRLFHRVQRKAIEIVELRTTLSEEIEHRYGFHYSDRNIDSIIECLDYGFDKMSFNEFITLLEEEKNND